MTDQGPTASANQLVCDEHRRVLLRVAHDAVHHGLTHREIPVVDGAAFDAELLVPRATFVTLKINNALRGCIGTLEARRPLVEDVAYNAFSAAFRDPRFQPVGYYEVHLLEYHISVLSPAVPMNVADEDDLIQQVRPGVDGLLLEETGQSKRGTFLPSVWESISQPRQFVTQLKRKAGLPDDYWSDTLKVSRYTSESF